MRRSRSLGLATVVLTVAAPLAAALTSPSPASALPRLPAASHGAVRGDLDGDGKPDLVAGAAGGRVRVTYTRAKPAGSHAQWITAPIANAFGFGDVLAVGDFNGDGFADLAIGAVGYEDGIDGTEQGAVFLYNGSKSGLHYTGVVFKGPDEPDDDNAFGTALAVGDLNGDGFADLAVGNPGPNGGGDGEGSVTVMFGSAAGITTAGQLNISSANPVEQGNFGTSVALADVNGDGHKDLIVGEIGGGPRISPIFDNAGDIQVFYGNATGLGARHTTILGSTVGAAGLFGWSLAAGDVNHDGFADVVVGAPDAIVSGRLYAGKVVVFAGGKHGLSAAHRRVLSEASRHVPGAVATGDQFGFAVSAGDLTGDRRAEVIVGARGAKVGGHKSAGVVYIFRGSRSGVTAVGCRRISQGSKGVPGAPLAGAQFGEAVGTLVVSTTGHRALLVGIPGKPKGGLVMIARLKSTGAIAQPVRLVRDSKPGDGLGTAFAA
jgi:FG-GAP repeat/FG-GAP-like repeat